MARAAGTVTGFLKMGELLRQNRLRINRELISHELRQYFSPSQLAHDRSAAREIRAHLSGQVLDIGAGHMPFRALAERRATRYDSLDIERRTAGLTHVGDVQDMNGIGDEEYDSALCLEVLEHVASPCRALSEIHRILKPGGKLLCSVPHLSRIHEAPNDYYRYTEYGLRHLFERAGFEVISIQAHGGIFCFLGHQLSTLLLCSVWHIPSLKSIVFGLNRIMIVRSCMLLDSWTDKNRLFALGYTCVVQKK